MINGRPRCMVSKKGEGGVGVGVGVFVAYVLLTVLNDIQFIL